MNLLEQRKQAYQNLIGYVRSLTDVNEEQEHEFLSYLHKYLWAIEQRTYRDLKWRLEKIEEENRKAQQEFRKVYESLENEINHLDHRPYDQRN